MTIDMVYRVVPRGGSNSQKSFKTHRSIDRKVSYPVILECGWSVGVWGVEGVHYLEGVHYFRGCALLMVCVTCGFVGGIFGVGLSWNLGVPAH